MSFRNQNTGPVAPENEQFSLEDILREFSGKDPMEEEAADLPMSGLAEPEKSAPEDTIRFQPVADQEPQQDIPDSTPAPQKPEADGPAQWKKHFWEPYWDRKEAEQETAEELPHYRMTGNMPKKPDAPKDFTLPPEMPVTSPAVPLEYEEPEEKAPIPKWREALQGAIEKAAPSKESFEADAQAQPEARPSEEPKPAAGNTIRFDWSTLGLQEDSDEPERDSKEEEGVSGDTISFHLPEDSESNPVSDDTVVFPGQSPNPPREPRKNPPKHTGKKGPAAPSFAQRLRQRMHQPTALPWVSAEERYRNAAQGLGGVISRTVICLVVSLVAVAVSIAGTTGLFPPSDGVSFPALLELALLLICSMLALDVLTDGISNLLQGRFTMNLLVTITILVCLADGVSSLLQGKGTYCPVACLLLLAAQWGLCMKRRMVCSTMDIARRAANADGLVVSQDVWNHKPGVLRTEPDEEGFLTNADIPGLPETILNWYGLGVLILSLVLTLLGKPDGLPVFLHHWTAVLLAGIPAASFLALWQPWALLSRQLHRVGAAFAGWRGVELLRKNLVVPIADGDLFPQDKLKLNGVKYFGEYPPDTVLDYAASVIEASNSGLTQVFNQQVAARNGRKYSISNLRRYENGGISGEIGTDSVMVGSLRFMQSMGVEMPRSTRVSQAVYVAINNDFCGVFAINYAVTRSLAETMTKLATRRGTTPVMATCDFMLTDAFLRAKFRMDTRGIQFPPLSSRPALAAKQPEDTEPQGALLSKPGFVPVANAVSGARSLHRSVMLGLGMVLFSGLMGMGMMAVLASLNADNVMTAGNLLKYLLLWAVPSLLVTLWPKFE